MKTNLYTFENETVKVEVFSKLANVALRGANNAITVYNKDYSANLSKVHLKDLVETKLAPEGSMSDRENFKVHSTQAKV